MKTLCIWILFLVTLISCHSKRPEEISSDGEFAEVTNQNEPNRIEIKIIPERTSKMTFDAKTVTDIDEIKKIMNFAKNDNPVTEYEKSPTLPDGYLAFYKNSDHLENIYFILDSNKTLFQYLDRDKVRQKEITVEGDKFFKKIYRQRDWLPQEIN